MSKQTWPNVGNNVKDDSSDHIMYFQSSDGQVLWSSHHRFNLLALFSVIRGSAIAAVPWMLDLWNSCQTVFVERSSRWILSSAVTFAEVLLWYIDTILFNVWWSLSLSSGFWPLFLLADDVRQWFVYVITLESAALDTLNKVAVLVTDVPAKCAPIICLLGNLRSLPFCSTSHKLLLNTICNALTLALHSTNKERNNTRYN